MSEINFRASRSKPCPVCKTGTKNCSATDDGLHFCRGEAGPGWKEISHGPDENGFRSYRQAEESRGQTGGRSWRVKASGHSGTSSHAGKTAGAGKNWQAEAEKFARNLTNESRLELAQALGLPVKALDSVPLLGWNPDDILAPCWTFPEVNAERIVTAINRRFVRPVSINGGDPTGKAVMGGGRRGLYLLSGWDEGTGPLLAPEGISDLIAQRLCGLDGVGRPSNTGGVEELVKILKKVDSSRPIYILGENDERDDPSSPTGKKWPGKEGTDLTAPAVAKGLGRPVGVAFPPAGIKDVREWVIKLAAEAGESPDWLAIRAEILAHIQRTAVMVTPNPTTSPDPKEPPPPRFPFIDSLEFLTSDYRQEYLINKILVRGQPGVIAGPSKSLKTTIGAVEMGLSLAAGVPFLGKFDVPRRVKVAIVSGESGMATLQETALRIIRDRGIDAELLPEWLKWCFELPRFPNLANMTEFARTLKGLNTEVVIIDPVYLCIGGEIDHANMFQMGEAFKVVADLLLKESVTPILIHHTNRQLKPGQPMELMHLAYSGLEQFARQFLLLNRQSEYRGDGVHDLWFSAGGSAGHGGLWKLHIEEGTADENFRGRCWKVTVTDPNKADEFDRREAAKDDVARRKMMAEDAKVLDAIDKIIGGGLEGATKSRIKTECPSLSASKISQIVDRLVEESVLESVEFDQIVARGRKQRASGFRRLCREDRDCA